MSKVVIQVEGIGKKYQIGASESDLRPRGRAWRSRILGVSPEPTGKSTAWRSGNGASGNGHLSPIESAREIWALRNVSFEVFQGETVGILGRNGSGKSTLLKILSQITKPTEGSGVIRGRVGSLLEVGSGFHPQLTGRENVYMNGAILGMRRAEIERKFDEIVAFAEVEKFIDTPVKYYSSGMHVRLGFAVAAHLESDVMIVDEVLSVGDMAFQRKCQKKIEEIVQRGATVLFVSHSLVTVKRLCPRSLWLNSGRLEMDGDTNEVAQAYVAFLAAATESQLKNEPVSPEDRKSDDAIIIHTNREFGMDIESVVLKNAQGEISAYFEPGQALEVEIWFNATRPIDKPYVWVSVESTRGTCFGANMLLDGFQPDILVGRGCIKCTFKSLPLLPQSYTIRMCFRANDGKTPIVEPQEAAFFRVGGDLHAYGYTGELAPMLLNQSYPVVVPYEWTLPNGETFAVALEEPQLVTV